MAKKKFYAIEVNGKQYIVQDAKKFEKLRNKNPKNARGKSFKTEKEAQTFLKNLPKAKQPAQPVATQKNNEAATDATNFVFPALIHSQSYHENKTSKKQATAIAYVDGSYNSELGVWGYGVVLFDKAAPNQRVYFSGVGNDATSSSQYSGEINGAVRAICEATQMGFRNIIIHYDLASIEDLATGNTQAKNILSQNYINFIHNGLIDISFVKVKAHSGNKFNEIADMLAHQAISLS